MIFLKSMSQNMLFDGYIDRGGDDKMNDEKMITSCEQVKNDDLYSLSTEALNAEIDCIMEQNAETMDTDRLELCLAILQERDPVIVDTTPDDAWNAFTEKCPVLTASEKQSHRSKRPHRIFRRTGLVAAAVIVVLGGMITAGATGVFSSFARWTSENFFFTPTGTEEALDNYLPATHNSNEISNPGYAELKSTLDELGAEITIVPSWMPEGFEQIGALDVYQDDGYWSVTQTFFNGDAELDFGIDYYANTEDVASIQFEKNDEAVEQYTVNEKTFYLMGNGDRGVCYAAWSDDHYVSKISLASGDRETLKQIVDSIGG